MRPGYSDASVPNCSAITSGAWFGSMMPPEPTRIVFVPAGDMADHDRRSPRWRCPSCCDARRASSAGSPSFSACRARSSEWRKASAAVRAGGIGDRSSTEKGIIAAVPVAWRVAMAACEPRRRSTLLKSRLCRKSRKTCPIARAVGFSLRRGADSRARWPSRSIVEDRCVVARRGRRTKPLSFRRLASAGLRARRHRRGRRRGGSTASAGNAFDAMNGSPGALCRHADFAHAGRQFRQMLAHERERHAVDGGDVRALDRSRAPAATPDARRFSSTRGEERPPCASGATACAEKVHAAVRIVVVVGGAQATACFERWRSHVRARHEHAAIVAVRAAVDVEIGRRDERARGPRARGPADSRRSARAADRRAARRRSSGASGSTISSVSPRAREPVRECRVNVREQRAPVGGERGRHVVHRQGGDPVHRRAILKTDAAR